MDTFFVYILRCNDSSYYVGVTNNYKLRIGQHQEGLDPRCYTFKRRPVQLVHLEEFASILDAIRREKQLKGWSRKKKEALITEHPETLPNLSRNRRNASTGSA